ncbi:MAG: protein kinase domain-containing protein, partial [Planctomycetota bacterium]
MSVAPGTSIGPYEVDHEIGRGGMGVVYLARDTRLRREVAIKALPEHLASDAGRLDRFEREARTLAQLNNANVAAIFGVEEQDGSRYLILEHVPGDTLADRLATGPLPVDEALDLAAGIAAGVQAAHEAGVVHRDLKPANIKITPEGTVKVLDFGLAKSALVESDTTSESPTVTAPAGRSPTIPGAILGTAPYMSPEQARGRPIDKRTDVWSFGVVLYEMLTGRVPFSGETATDAIGAILHQEVDYARLPARTPPNVRMVLRRCLARKPGDRFDSMGDIGILLGERGVDGGGAAAGRARRGPAVLVTSLLLVGALAFAAGAWVRGLLRTTPASPARASVAFEIELPANQVIEWRGTGSMMAKVGIAPMIDISPDGTRVVYAAHTGGATSLYVRDLDDVTIRELPGTARRAAGVRQSARAPFFSPDGEWVAFVADEVLQKVRLAGGMPQPIDRLSSTSVDGEWSPDGQWILYASDSGLWRVPANGGAAEQLTAPDPQRGEIAHFFPHIVHDGGAVLFTVMGETGPSVAVLDLASGRWSTVFENASDARPYGGDRVVFARGRGLLTMPVDPDTFTPTGDAIPLTFASDV